MDNRIENEDDGCDIRMKWLVCVYTDVSLWPVFSVRMFISTVCIRSVNEKRECVFVCALKLYEKLDTERINGTEINKQKLHSEAQSY